MRIFKKGRKWYVDYTYKGRRYRKAISRHKRTAEKALNDIELKIDRGEHLGITEEKRVTLKDFAERYLEYSKTNKRPRTFKRDITSLRALTPFLGGSYLGELNLEKIERYKSIRKGQVSPASVNRELGCLRHLLNRAVEWGYLKHSPMKGVEFLKEPAGRTRFLSRSELQILLDESAPRLRPIVLTAVTTGMRLGEVMDLTWSCVNFTLRTITIERTKNNETRVVPISDILMTEVLKLPREDERVFPYPFPRKTFANAVKRAKIKDFRFHDLRHTFASYLAMGGYNLRTIQQLLGHKDLRMVMRYSHLSSSHLGQAVNAVTNSMLEVGTDLALLENRIAET